MRSLELDQAGTEAAVTDPMRGEHANDRGRPVEPATFHPRPELSSRDLPMPASKRLPPSNDWRSFVREHAEAVAQENRAYVALTEGSRSTAIPGNHSVSDRELMANWEQSKQAVTRAWEKLHRHAVAGSARF